MTGPVADPTGVMAALSVDEVSHRFGAKTALDAVSLTVAAGCFTTLLGINGAGKTTLFNLITRLYGARAGRIQVCGHDLRRHPRQALARMSTVFQSPSLDRALTVRQNLYYHGALHRPALLLCDEATIGLDVKAHQDIVAYLHDETAAGRLGVLWATHLTEEVALDDPVMILHQGRVKARGLARPCANRQKAR